MIEEHDRKAEHTVVGTQFYLDELARRQSDGIAKRIERLTVVITILTAANVVAAVATLIATLSN